MRIAKALVPLSLLVSFMPVAAEAGTTELVGRIVFVDAFGGTGLYTISPDGSDRFRVLDHPPVSFPRWAPDGSGIAFRAESSFPPRRISFVESDGSDVMTLVSPSQLPDGWSIGLFDWSPTGTDLVVELRNVNRSRLYMSALDGSPLVQIATNAGSPDWSGSDRLVVTQGRRIVTMDPDGGNVEIVVGGGNNSLPRWSPDSSQIVYEHLVDRVADVFVVNADGSERTNLTRSRRVYDWSPSWSPDGRRIVWAPSPPGDFFGYADLWWMRADGANETQITGTKRNDEYAPDWAEAPV